MNLRVLDLKTEYLNNPLGIDSQFPRFSWKLDSDSFGIVQKCYQIIVFNDEEILWDSGNVKSINSQRIRYEGKPLKSRQVIKWVAKVTVIDINSNEETATSDENTFEMGLLEISDWKAKWIEPEREIDVDARKPVNYLRRDFTVKKGLISARIYQTSHGLYECWLNNNLVTLDKFKPGLTSYYHRIQYQIYDITKLLLKGNNCWSVMLGDGWWRGITGGTVKNNFGYKVQYFGQIELNYEDGTRDIIGTDEYFKTSTGGLIASDMMMGEIYNACLEPASWRKIGFNDNEWKDVQISYDRINSKLISSRSVPVREKERFNSNKFRDVSGNLILDFGQNIAGYVKMKLRNCIKGQKIRLVHGEDINAEGDFSIENISQSVFKTTHFQEVIYICKGEGIEEYTPMFSVFGFRYVLLEGYSEDEIQPNDFIAIALYSDMEQTGSFTCSNKLINKLVKNSLWSQKGNFLDVPVDCPTRERNAWTGDNQVYVRTASYFMNVYSFYEKWLQDQSIEQYESGKVGITFPSTSSVHNPDALAAAKLINPSFELAGPTGNGNIGEDCAGWGDSVAWLPYCIYLSYGDEQIIKNQYHAAKKWVDYMLSCAKDHNPLYESEPQYHNYTNGVLDADFIYDTRMHYGEWQEPIDKPVPKDEDLRTAFIKMIKEGNPKVATAYMCRSSENVSKMARVLGKYSDAEKYENIANQIRYVYDKYLIDSEGCIEPGHQAAYIRALAFGLCSDEKLNLVRAQLVHEIESNNYKLNTGFLSTPFLLPTLVDMGRADLAFRVLEQTENPSWLHPILLGATTIPESWNGYDMHDGSYNHYSYGAVCEFLFSYVGGIQPIWEYPGYQKFIIKPVSGGTLNYANTEYESIYGTIKTYWKKNEEGLIQLECTIPANTRAVIKFPSGKSTEIGSGKYTFINYSYE